MRGYGALMGLSTLGLATSTWLVAHHYGRVGSGALCELGSSLSCAEVLGSDWAILLGVPVAVHGCVYFLLALTAAVLGFVYDHTDFRISRDILLANVGCHAVGMLSVFYFLFAEWMLGAICPLCTVVHIAVLLSLLQALYMKRQSDFKNFWSFSVFKDFVTLRLNFVLGAVAFALLPILLFHLPGFHPSYDPSRVESLANCLQERGATMFGAAGCSHCIQQKALFGEAFKTIRFVDCALKESTGICFKENIKGYPTWVLGQSRLEGSFSLKKIADWAGCLI